MTHTVMVTYICLPFLKLKREVFSIIFNKYVNLFSLRTFMNDFVILSVHISTNFPHFGMVHGPDKFIFTNNPD